MDVGLRTACLKYLLGKERGDWEAGHTGTGTGIEAAAFQAVVFAEGYSRAGTEALVAAAEAGLGAAPGSGVVQSLSSEASLDVRAGVVGAFRAGACAVLVCCDGGARGLDVPGGGLIVQMALPGAVDTYLHRAGRTGRMGRAGKVITLTSPGEDFVIQRYSMHVW